MRGLFCGSTATVWLVLGGGRSVVNSYVVDIPMILVNKLIIEVPGIVRY